jgi:hypothetical protein
MNARTLAVNPKRLGRSRLLVECLEDRCTPSLAAPLAAFDPLGAGNLLRAVNVQIAAVSPETNAIPLASTVNTVGNLLPETTTPVAPESSGSTSIPLVSIVANTVGDVLSPAITRVSTGSFGSTSIPLVSDVVNAVADLLPTVNTQVNIGTEASEGNTTVSEQTVTTDQPILSLQVEPVISVVVTSEPQPPASGKNPTTPSAPDAGGAATGAQQQDLPGSAPISTESDGEEENTSSSAVNPTAGATQDQNSGNNADREMSQTATIQNGLPTLAAPPSSVNTANSAAAGLRVLGSGVPLLPSFAAEIRAPQEALVAPIPANITTDPSSPDLSPSDQIPSATPRVAGLFQDTANANLDDLAAGMRRFLDGLEDGVGGVIRLPESSGLLPWVVSAAVSAAALEVALRQVRRRETVHDKFPITRNSGLRFSEPF